VHIPKRLVHDSVMHACVAANRTQGLAHRRPVHDLQVALRLTRARPARQAGPVQARARAHQPRRGEVAGHAAAPGHAGRRGRAARRGLPGRGRAGAPPGLAMGGASFLLAFQPEWAVWHATLYANMQQLELCIRSSEAGGAA